MKEISDRELLEELKQRIEQRNLAYKELKQLNVQLQDVNKKLTESEKLKTNFLSNARNEIINPLSSILSLSKALAFDENTSKAEAQRLAAIIFKEALDLDFQMNNIFSSAEIEAGEAYVEVYDIDLPELIEFEMKKFEQLAMKKGLTLKFEQAADDGVRILKSDPAKIKLIIDNLIVNAINWSDKKGEILLRLQKKGKNKIFMVTDLGPGIDKKDRDAIFDRFKTLNQAVHTENKGHGLGLSIVKAYTEMIEGTIDIKSSPGAGSTFTVTFRDVSPEVPIQGTAGSGQDFLFGDGELF